MSDTLRAFIATRCDLDEFPELTQVREQLVGMAPAVKIVPSENLHLTWRFLGTVFTKQIDPLVAALRETLDAVNSFTPMLAGIGAFPNSRRPNVIWAGLQPVEEFAEIVSAVDLACDSVGFSPDEKPFVPHITIARVKKRPPPKLEELIKQQDGTTFGEIRMSQVILMQSTLRPSGPIYEPVEAIQLD